MIRKQLYITDEQDRRLKRRAAELGVSEAELVRRALDDGIDRTTVGPVPRVRKDAIDRFLDNAERFAAHAGAEPGWRFERDEIYEPTRGHRTG